MPSQQRPKYVIINDLDVPRPDLVCQLVPGVGYCYLDRAKREFDGMSGDRATDVRDFGFSIAENRDGTVSFYRNDEVPRAVYLDGEPRRWQGRGASFEFKMIKDPPAGT